MFRLRWRFEYADAKPAKYGIWDYTDGDKHPENSAWAVSKENLLYAVIESECLRTHEITRVIECKGADFCNFAWVAAQPFTGSGEMPAPRILGLQLVSRDFRTTAFYDGTTRMAERDEADKATQFRTYGR